MRGIFRSLAVVCGWAWLACAAAQPQQGRPGQAISVPGSLAQRLSACTSCHGSASTPPAATGAGGERQYFPRIAGKPAGYLYNQLINFREGRRQYPLMTWMVQHLSDDYLHE